MKPEQFVINLKLRLHAVCAIVSLVCATSHAQDVSNEPLPTFPMNTVKEGLGPAGEISGLPGEPLLADDAVSPFPEGLPSTYEDRDGVSLDEAHDMVENWDVENAGNASVEEAADEFEKMHRDLSITTTVPRLKRNLNAVCARLKWRPSPVILIWPRPFTRRY